MDASRPSRRSQIAIIIAFAAFLAVGALGLVVRVPDLLPSLGGVEVAPPPVNWSFEKFRLGPLEPKSPQFTLEAHANARFGWRNFLVRLDHQLSWSLFLETHPLPVVNGEKVGTRVIYGHHEWLFEEHYIQHAVTPTAPADAELREIVARIKRVQDKLARRGIPFLLVVAPSKAEVYPEKVPLHIWNGRDPATVTTKFERARPFFNEAGVHWIDGPALYSRWKTSGKRNLFARSGTHWSYISAVDVLGEIRAQLNQTMRRPMPALPVVGQDLLAPQMNDRDILDLANLLVSAPYEHSVPFPRIEAQREIAADQLPRIMWVHDSFGWPLIELIYRGKVAAPSESFYYFAPPTRIPGRTNLGWELESMNWPDYLAQKDAVVVVWTEIATDFWGWGFFEAVDKSLD